MENSFTRGVGRRLRIALLTTSVFGGLAGATEAAAAPQAIIPTGGNIISGTASITTQGATLTVDQLTSKAIIDWSSFSIGQSGKVRIDNGSGATLNRVTGLAPSQINGLLSSTGSVYLLNANGVIIGKTGVVSTGGTFVASTLDVTNDNFLADGPLTFAGPSTASVVNLGKVGSLGGNVALIAQSVTNAGNITAANGTIGLASGSLITLTDDTADDGGLIAVQIGEMGDNLTNEGALAAAAVELRAQQGNIYALAGNTGSAIDATGVAERGGKIFLVSGAGETTITGTLDAQGPDGTPGSVETSGATLDIRSAVVNAHGGTWLLDPSNLTIDAVAARTIDGALAADTSVTERTTSTGASGSGTQSSGNGDITVAAALSWSTAATLTLDAYHSIFIDAPITVAGAGGVAIKVYSGGLFFAQGDSLNFTSESSKPTYSYNGYTYTLLYALANSGSTGSDRGTDDIAGIDNNTAAGGDNGFYALATNLTAPSGTTFTSALAGANGNTFDGVFEGLGHTISGLTIKYKASGYFGLFGASFGDILDIGLIGGSVSTSATVGGVGVNGVSSLGVGELVGSNSGLVRNSYATGMVTGLNGDVGGLIGVNTGVVENSFAAVAVTGQNASVGGLVGSSGGTYGLVTNSYATGAVSGTAGGSVGGLVGDAGKVSNSFATGAVSGSNVNLGGLVGDDTGSSVNNSYWDVLTTGQTSGFGVGSGNATGLTTAQFQSGSASGLGSAFGGGTGGLYPYLAAVFPNGVQVVSGFAYSNSGVTPLASGKAGAEYISLSFAGAGAQQVATGANGYYYFIEPAGTFSSSGAAALAYATTDGTTTGAATGAHLASLTGTTSGFDIWGSTLIAPTAATTLSGAATADPTVSALLLDNQKLLSSLTTQPAALSNLSHIGYVGTSPDGLILDEAIPATGLYVATTTGPITLMTAQTLTGQENLSLIAGGDLAIDSSITVSGAGAVKLAYGPANLLTFAEGASIDYGATNIGGSLSINGQTYTLLYAVADSGSTGPDAGTSDVAGIDHAGDSGLYALATNLSAPQGMTFASALAGAGSNVFSGVFEGLGHTITGLVINSSNTYVGLFGQNSGVIRDVSLVGGSVTGGDHSLVGALVGFNFGTVETSHATGPVASGAYGYAGGLVGSNNGTVEISYATGAVSGGESARVGGLVAYNSAAVDNTYATGAVSAGADADVGGLIGQNTGTVETSYATGLVSGGSAAEVGGLVGVEAGSLANGYWDSLTSGVTNAFGQGNVGSATGLTTSEFQSGGASGLGSAFGGGTEGLYPYLVNFFPSGVQAISGLAYSDVGVTALAGQTVSLIAGGTATGSVSTGANGYYYLALPPSALAASEVLLAYAPTAHGATLASTSATLASTGPLTGPNLYGQTMTVPTATATLSTAPSLSQAQTSAIAADDSSHDAQSTIAAATGLGLITSAAGFTVDQTVTTGGLFIQTTAADAPITVSSPVTSTHGSGVALLASGALTINAPIVIDGAGTGNLANGSAASYSFGPSGSLTYNNANGSTATQPVTGQLLAINGQTYALLYALADNSSNGPDAGMDDIAGIDAHGAAGADAGFYALATNLTAPTSATFMSPLAGAGSNVFAGVFEGLGHTITDLTIADAVNAHVGLFGQSSGVIRDIGLVGGSVSSSLGADVGDLVGTNRGAVDNSSASGTVTASAGAHVGGLVGFTDSGSISDSRASGLVSGLNDVGGLVGDDTGASLINVMATGAVTGAGDYVGGLVGYNKANINNAMATGAVAGVGYVGGLVGGNFGGEISDVLATGAVTGGLNTGGYDTGALAGYSSNTVTAGYWDTQTTGLTTSSGGGAGLTTAQLQSGGASLGSGFGGGSGGLYPYLTTFFPGGVQALIGTATAGAQVAIYHGGAELGGGTVSVGANGYVYLAVPAGPLGPNGNVVGETLTLAGATTPSALSYSDTPQVAGNQLTLPSFTAGTVVETTIESFYSIFERDVAATFGAANLAALNSALAGSPIRINATSYDGFTVDQAINAASSFQLIASEGGITLNDPIIAGGSILVASNGAFVNTDGASALTPGNGDSFTIFSQVNTRSNERYVQPNDNFDGLKATYDYSVLFNFTTAQLSSAHSFLPDLPGGNLFAFPPLQPDTGPPISAPPPPTPITIAQQEGTDLSASAGASPSAAETPETFSPASNFVFNLMASFGGGAISAPLDIDISADAPYPINLGLGPNITFQGRRGGQ